MVVRPAVAVHRAAPTLKTEEPPLAEVLDERGQQDLLDLITAVDEAGAHFSTGISAERSRERTSEEILELVLKNPSTFSSKIFVVSASGERDRVEGLDDLHTAHAIFARGPTDHLRHPRLAQALRHFEGAGFAYKKEGRKKHTTTGAGALEAYRLLDKRERVYLKQSDEKGRWVNSPEEAGAFDFFRQTGDPATVSEPELAQNILGLKARGYQFQASRWMEDDPLPAYMLAHRGNNVSVAVGGVEVGSLRDFKPEGDETIDLYAATLEPLVEEGFGRKALQKGFERIQSEEVPGTNAVQRGKALAELIRAADCGPAPAPPERSWTPVPGSAERGLRLYDRLRRENLTGTTFLEAAGALAALVRVSGTDSGEHALDFIGTTLLKTSPFASMRQHYLNRTVEFTEMLGGLHEGIQAAALTEREESARVLKALAAVSPEHALKGFHTLLGPAPPDTDPVELYLTLLRGLQPLERTEEADETYRAIRDGLALGRLQGDPMELAAAALRRAVQGNSPAEQPACAEEIHVEPDFVDVGSFRVSVEN